jgi:hypothetical protein
MLDRCGFDGDEAVREFRAAWSSTPEPANRRGMDLSRTHEAGAHIITLWYMTTGYVDARGRPIAIKLKGPAPSIEALIAAAGVELSAESMVKYLLATKALKRRAKMFVPTSRSVRHPTDSRFQHAHSLKVVAGLLRTLESNARRGSRRPWLQMVADGWIPENRLQAANQSFRDPGVHFLEWADTLMLREATATKDKGRNVPLTVAVFVFDGRPSAPVAASNLDSRRSRSIAHSRGKGERSAMGGRRAVPAGRRAMVKGSPGN